MTDTARPPLETRLGPLTLSYPLINASGTFDLFALAEAFGPDVLVDPPVAAYVPKTITVDPRRGNPSPRLLEAPSGLVNAIGLANEGWEAFATAQLPRLLALPCPVIISIGGFSPDEYMTLAQALREALEKRDAATAGEQGGRGAGPLTEPRSHPGEPRWKTRVGLELNISCPNVHSGCLSIGTDAAETYNTVKAVRAVWPGLLVAKLTPNVTDIVVIARAAVEAGADVLAAVNTYKALLIDRRTLRPYLGNITGGLSGPAIKPLALRTVYELFASVEVPIIGMGGVTRVQDVLDFLACGARVVAVGSGILRDPWLAQRLSFDLAQELAARALSLSQVVGCAHSL